MDGLALLKQAADAGLTVRFDHDRLVIRGPKNAETTARLLIDNKAAVAAALVPEPKSIGDLEERAAIVEEGAGVPRVWAEGFARLCIMPRPERVPEHRWRRLVDAAGVFIDRWAAQAAALGWDTTSVFGCHPERPDARLDMQGLAWLISDGEIVAIGEATAKIRAASGGTLTYRRRSIPAGEAVAVAWELQR